MTDSETFRIEDGRDLPVVFIHSELDDLPLTPNAFRIYGHLARRAGRDGEAWPSYKSMGEKCLRPMYRNAKPETLRRRAKEAVEELERFGLIFRIERTGESGVSLSNGYRLAHRDEWNQAEIAAATAELRGGGQRPLGGQRPEANAPQGANAPKDHPNEVNPPKDHPEGGSSPHHPPKGGDDDDTPQGDDLGDDFSLKAGGMDSSNGAGPAGNAPIAELWVDVFGELTDKQRSFIDKQAKARGAELVIRAIGKTQAAIEAGTEVKLPAAYVKKILEQMERDRDYGGGGSSAGDRNGYLSPMQLDGWQ